ncbi:Serine/threonine protein kinase, AGC [Hanseniaspora vineae]
MNTSKVSGAILLKIIDNNLGYAFFSSFHFGIQEFPVSESSQSNDQTVNTKSPMFSSWKIGKKFNFGSSSNDKHHDKHHQTEKNSQKLDESVSSSKAAQSKDNSSNVNIPDRRQTIVATPQSMAPTRLSTDIPRPSVDSSRTTHTQNIITTTSELASNYSSSNTSATQQQGSSRQSVSTPSKSKSSSSALFNGDYQDDVAKMHSQNSSSAFLNQKNSSTEHTTTSNVIPESQQVPPPQPPAPSVAPAPFQQQEQTNSVPQTQNEDNSTASSQSGIMTIKVYSGDSFKLPFPIIYNQQLLSRLLSSSNSKQAPNLMDDLNKYMEILSLNNAGKQAANGNDRGGSMGSMSSSPGASQTVYNPQKGTSAGNMSDSMNSSVTADDGATGSVSNDSFKHGQENIIPGDVATHYIPSAITLPGSSDLNPLIYFTIEFDNTTATIEPESGTMNHPVFNKISTFDVTRKLPFLKIDVFCRIPSILLPKDLLSNANEMSGNEAPGSNSLNEMVNKIVNNQDVHLITYNLPLNLNFTTASNIRIYNHKWININELGTRLNLTIDYKPLSNKKLSIDDFELLKVIGKGSFGKVMQVRKKDTNKIYALKAIRKSYIVSNSEVTHTLAERTVLAQIQCPFIVPLKFSFQSKEKLYLVLALINGGELFYHLQKEGRFTLSRSRFYTAELLVALESLHALNVIYRDLKPENILLDYQGHIALCDFGLCKLDMKDKDKTSTFCGTPEYLAPELLLGEGYTRVVDWWTLGVLLYEMLTGLPPYYDEDIPTMYKKILQEPLKFPEGFDEDAKDLLVRLLNRDPRKRLGSNGAHEIKSHPFFSQLSWKRLTMKGYIPPYKPPVANSLDTSNFDSEFTKEKPVDSVVCDFLSESVQQQFGGWTYVGNEQL